MTKMFTDKLDFIRIGLQLQEGADHANAGYWRDIETTHHYERIITALRAAAAIAGFELVDRSAPPAKLPQLPFTVESATEDLDVEELMDIEAEAELASIPEAEHAGTVALDPDRQREDRDERTALDRDERTAFDRAWDANPDGPGAA